jgi:hypothetical protein
MAKWVRRSVVVAIVAGSTEDHPFWNATDFDIDGNGMVTGLVRVGD